MVEIVPVFTALCALNETLWHKQRLSVWTLLKSTLIELGLFNLDGLSDKRLGSRLVIQVFGGKLGASSRLSEFHLDYNDS